MPLDLAYVAGFIDGEGCFDFVKSRKSITPRIVVVNTNKEIIEEFKSNFGGDITVREHKDHPNWKITYVWRLQHSAAIELTRKLLPYLKVKAPQARLIIEFGETRPGSGKRLEPEKINSFIQRMHLLNKKGR